MESPTAEPAHILEIAFETDGCRIFIESPSNRRHGNSDHGHHGISPPMSTSSILYIAPLITDEIEDAYGLDWYSPAGNKKRQGIIDCLIEDGYDVTVVSPPPLRNAERKTRRSQKFYRDNAVEVVVPAVVNVFNITPLNYLLLACFTTLTVLRLSTRQRWDAIMFYNFRLETAVPAALASTLSRVPAVLEYEDGLFVDDCLPIRLLAWVLRLPMRGYVGGAICVNRRLESQVLTKNTAIVRGFPSIGLPDDLPPPAYTSDDRTVIMFAGKLDRIRGVDRFLDVISVIDREDLLFWISGHGPPQEVRRVAQAVDVLDDERVEYFGTLPWEEYRRRVVSADVLVNLQNPNHRKSEYSFPSKLLDFMSAGATIVTTDMSDISNDFRDEMVIIGVHANKVEDALEMAIAECQDNPRGERAQQWIRTNCTYWAVGKNIRTVIEHA